MMAVGTSGIDAVRAPRSVRKVRDIKRGRQRTEEVRDQEEAHKDDDDVEEDRRKLERRRSTLVHNIHNFFTNDGPSLGLWGL